MLEKFAFRESKAGTADSLSRGRLEVYARLGLEVLVDNEEVRVGKQSSSGGEMTGGDRVAVFAVKKGPVRGRRPVSKWKARDNGKGGRKFKETLGPARTTGHRHLTGAIVKGVLRKQQIFPRLRGDREEGTMGSSGKTETKRESIILEDQLSE